MNCHTLYTKRAPRVLRRGAAILGVMLVGLAGCAATPPAPDPPLLLRNPTAPFGGTSRFEVARFAGDWITVGCIGTCASKVRYVVATDDVFVRQVADESTGYVIEAPGVLRKIGSADRLVVMWVDTGFRTAAVGDADGRWAAVIDRTGRGGVDRIAAAREILDFNGWDLSKLREVRP